MQEAFGHPYGFQVYAFVIGFLVVLRTNHALARFMEARGHVEQMGSKWADAVVMCVSFDSCTTGKRSASGDEPMDMNAPLSEGSEHFIARLTHLVSLMHALALQHLRGDETLSNLTAAIRRKDGGPQLPEYNGTYFDFGPSAAASAHQQQHDGDRYGEGEAKKALATATATATATAARRRRRLMSASKLPVGSRPEPEPEPEPEPRPGSRTTGYWRLMAVLVTTTNHHSI